jgi:hypothetical protein
MDNPLRALAGGPGRPVTAAGGANPLWGVDGRELFFLNGSMLTRAAVTSTAAGIEVGAAEPLFDLAPRLGDFSAGVSNVYGVAPDGQRFLLAVPQRLATETIALVANWRAALGDRGGVTR